MSNLFEQASKVKLRFLSLRGALSTEDLWELPLTSKSGFSLNNVAKDISRALKEEGDEDFVGQGSTTSITLNLAMSIVKHIIAMRLEENKAKTDAVLSKQHKQKIAGIIQEKKDESLKDLSVEELEKLL